MDEQDGVAGWGGCVGLMGTGYRGVRGGFMGENGGFMVVVAVNGLSLFAKCTCFGLMAFDKIRNICHG